MPGLNVSHSPISALVGCPLPLMCESIAGIVVEHGVRVVARCADAIAAREAIDAATPDLALLDFGARGLDVLRDVRRARLPTRVVLFVDGPDTPFAVEAVELGVDGLLPRAAALATVRACVGGVAAGGQWLDPQLTAAIYAGRTASRSAPGGLTPRERDVARLVASGQRNRGIAEVLGISEGTVKMHLHNAYAKLGLETRTQLAMDTRLRSLG